MRRGLRGVVWGRLRWLVAPCDGRHTHKGQVPGLRAALVLEMVEFLGFEVEIVDTLVYLS